MRATHIRKFLLTGTALVAVSFLSSPAQAAAQQVSATSTLITSIDEAPQPAGNPGSVGDAGTIFTAGATSGTPLIATLPAGNTITGQTGAAGSVSGAVPQAGGAGFDFNAESGVSGTPLSVLNDSAVTGGAGGNAFSSGAAVSAVQAGGAGATGIKTGTGSWTSVTGTGTITGGAGGIGSFGNGASTAGGAGGAAGAAVRVDGANAVINDTGVITGGVGGEGGSPTGVTSIGGVGGYGGNGIHLSTTASDAAVTITANVTGGAGGDSGAGTVVANAAVGGLGGDGIRVEGSTETITITGATTAVTGGASGNSILGTSSALAVTGTHGGSGIELDEGTGDVITNAGIIKGGAGGAGVTAGLSGIAVNIDEAGSSLVALTNTGTIGDATTQTSSALYIGGQLTSLNNTGTIVNNATGTSNATVVIAGDQAGNNLTNAGIIKNASTSNSAYAIEISSAQTGDTIINSSTGAISAIGAGTSSAPTATAVHFGNASALAFTNQGSIVGNITDAGINATPTFTNSGTILGNIVLTDTNIKSITLTSGSVTGVGVAVSTIDLAGVAGNNVVSQSGGTVTGTSQGALLFGTGTNSFTQTGGTLSSLAGSATAVAITGGGGNTTLTLGGGSIIGVTDLGAGANVINVNGAFTTDGMVEATGGSIALTSEAGGTFNVANAVTVGTGAVATSGSGIINVETGGSIVTSGAVTTAGTGGITLSGGNLTTTGALTNNAAVIINPGSTLTAATQTAGTGTYDFSVKSTSGTVTGGLLTLTGGGLTMSGSTIKGLVAGGSGTIATGSVVEVASGSAPVVSLPNGGTSNTAVSVASGTDLYEFQYALGTNATVLAADPTATANQIYLIVTPNPVIAGLSNNDNAVNTALSSFGGEGVSATPGETQLNTIIGKIGAETTAAAVHADLQHLTPTVDGGARMAALNVVGETQDIATNRMIALRDGDPLSGVAAGASSHGASMWYEGYGQHAVQQEMDDVNGYKATTWGGAVGVDGVLSQESGSIIGIAFNYGHSAVDSDNANSTVTDLGNYGVNTYGTFYLTPHMFLNGQLGFAYNSITSYRHDADLAGDTAEGRDHSSQYSSKFDLGRDFPAGGQEVSSEYVVAPMTLTPDVSAAYTYLDTQGYTEKGAGGADNTVAGNGQSLLNLGVGGTITWNIKDNDAGSMMKPSLHAGYSYDAINSRVQTASSFTGDPASNIFITEGASPARNIFDAGAKFVYMSAANWDLSANYDFQAKQDYKSNTGELRATTHF